MKTLISGGCSFVLGNELRDYEAAICQSGNENYFSPNTCAGLVAKHFNLEYTCTALGGSANNAISRHVIDGIHGKFEPLVVIMWSFLERHEFRFAYQVSKNNHWHSVNMWDSEATESTMREYFGKGALTENEERILQGHLKRIEEIRRIGIYDFAKQWYKNVGIDACHVSYLALKELVFMQNILQQMRIPYVFTFADTRLMDCLTNPSKWSEVTRMATLVDKTRCMLEPRVGFYDWAKYNKFPMGTTHPLEEAHIEFSKLLINFTESLYV